MAPHPPAAASLPPAHQPHVEPTHACMRCGRPGVAPENALCEDCNPLELAQPSATQVHGIALVGIMAFVVVLAVLGRYALAGVGPFGGAVTGVEPVSGGLLVGLLVRNEGTKGGATTCRIVPDTRPVGGPSEVVQTPSVPAEGEIRFSVTLTRLGTQPIGLVADCQSP